MVNLPEGIVCRGWCDNSHIITRGGRSGWHGVSQWKLLLQWNLELVVDNTPLPFSAILLCIIKEREQEMIIKIKYKVGYYDNFTLPSFMPGLVYCLLKYKKIYKPTLGNRKNHS